MILRQTLERAVSGFWDGGYKQVFDWKIDGTPSYDAQGAYVRIGSWDANHWFHVAVGRTERETLRNAMFHLRAATKVASTFEYVEEE